MKREWDRYQSMERVDCFDRTEVDSAVCYWRLVGILVTTQAIER